MWFELLILIIGIAYGYFSAGKQDLVSILKTGAIIGIVLGVIFGLLGMFLGGFSLMAGARDAIGTFIGIVILAIIFIVGVFIGDFLEGAMKK